MGGGASKSKDKKDSAPPPPAAAAASSAAGAGTAVVKVKVPPGGKAGKKMTVTGPDGREHVMKIPRGKKAGDTWDAEVPVERPVSHGSHFVAPGLVNVSVVLPLVHQSHALDSTVLLKPGAHTTHGASGASAEPRFLPAAQLLQNG